MAGFFALAACASPPTPYQPALGKGSYGFSEVRLDERTWRVSFSGNISTDRGVVENYMLFRAAEVALLYKADGFVVLNEDVERDVSYYGGGYYPYGGFYYGSSFHRRRHRRSSHFGFSYSASPSYGVSRYNSQATVRLFQDPAPEGLGPAYNARSVIETLGPRIRRPEDLQS